MTGLPNYVFNESTTLDNFTNITTTEFPWQFGPFEQYDEFWVGVWINRLYLRFLTAIGVPGNLAALVTILKTTPVSSSSIYIAWLALCDGMALILMLIFQELARANIPISDQGCRFQFFVINSLIMICNWTLVSMTMERFIAIWFPFQVSRICTKRNAKIMICIIVIFFLALNAHFLFVYEETLIRRPVCGPMKEYEYFMLRIWYYIDCAFFAILPSLILLILNGLIIQGMHKSQEIQKEVHNTAQQQDKMKQQRQITRMLITVSVVFVILVTPNGIHYIYQNYWVRSTPRETAVYVMVDNMIRCLSTCNHAINFFFYFLAGQKFRNKFLEIFFCRRDERMSRYASTNKHTISQPHHSNTSRMTVSTINTQL